MHIVPAALIENHAEAMPSEIRRRPPPSRWISSAAGQFLLLGSRLPMGPSSPVASLAMISGKQLQFSARNCENGGKNRLLRSPEVMTGKELIIIVSPIHTSDIKAPQL
nr:hypothetical protein Iba_chr03bCG2400 [Ipomoea batatas]GMC74981.1 hypothetical protein Iba_chr03dCG0750 [Ipomoea batatas]